LGAAGFHNLETTFKYRIIKDPGREFVMSVGLSVEWGGTGAESVEPTHSTPTHRRCGLEKGSAIFLTACPGFGPSRSRGRSVMRSRPDAPRRLSGRPDSGDLTADTEFHPRVLNWGGTIQYSMPYLKSAVIDLGLPDFINRFIPIVEATLQTPVSNTFTSGTMTTGTINPGFLWVGNKFQVGIEALIPINRQSGTNVGVIAQLHFYLDDIDPRGIGKPILAAGPARKPLCKELIMRRPAIVAIIPLLLLLVTDGASAHALLDHAEPRVGNTVATAPREVTLWFTQKLEPAFSSITVTNSAGQRVDAGKTRVSGNQMSVSLRSGGAGTYRVNWRVLSVDTHRTDGNFTFRVGQ
jgi:Uncharacterized protein, homolog of Cu resistance protein CopC